MKNEKIKQLRVELERDKARLDWLDKCHEWQIQPTRNSDWICKVGHNIREAIDAAMSEARQSCDSSRAGCQIGKTKRTASK